MKIIEKKENAEVYSPYNKNFVDDLKTKIGGCKWNGECWVVPLASVEKVREIMMECYGENDRCGAEKFSATFKIDRWAERSSVTAFGKPLAIAYGRDSGARLGEGFEMIDGNIKSGGSARNWISEAVGTFVARSITKAMIDRETGSDIEIIDVKKENGDLEKLILEKERLLSRIEEIDKILNGGKKDE